MDNSNEPPRATDALLTDAEGRLEAVGRPLWRDTSFWGMTATQFLGAFNDNLYKQAALLVCTDMALKQNSSIDLQDVALALFALPFVIFSGFAGYLSDRTSKRRIVVLCKIAE